MENYGLDLHGEMLLEEYRQQLPLYNRLMEAVKSKLSEMVKDSDLTVSSMEFRIKEEPSLAGKLLRKGSKYSSLKDITDIFGKNVASDAATAENAERPCAKGIYISEQIHVVYYISLLGLTILF